MPFPAAIAGSWPGPLPARGSTSSDEEESFVSDFGDADSPAALPPPSLNTAPNQRESGNSQWSMQSDTGIAPLRFSLPEDAFNSPKSPGSNSNGRAVEVRILSTSQVVEGGVDANKFTVFNVRVTFDGETWTVAKRFRVFLSLHAELKQQHPLIKLPQAPKKKYLGANNPSFIQQRRFMLQRYLQSLTSNAALRRSSTLLNFLEATPAAMDLRRQCAAQQSLLKSSLDDNARAVVALRDKDQENEDLLQKLQTLKQSADAARQRLGHAQEEEMSLIPKLKDQSERLERTHNKLVRWRSKANQQGAEALAAQDKYDQTSMLNARARAELAVLQQNLAQKVEEGKAISSRKAKLTAKLEAVEQALQQRRKHVDEEQGSLHELRRQVQELKLAHTVPEEDEDEGDADNAVSNSWNKNGVDNNVHQIGRKEANGINGGQDQGQTVPPFNVSEESSSVNCEPDYINDEDDMPGISQQSVPLDVSNLSSGLFASSLASSKRGPRR